MSGESHALDAAPLQGGRPPGKPDARPGLSYVRMRRMRVTRHDIGRFFILLNSANLSSSDRWGGTSSPELSGCHLFLGWGLKLCACECQPKFARSEPRPKAQLGPKIRVSGAS